MGRGAGEGDAAGLDGEGAGLVVGVADALRVTRFEDGLGGKDLAVDDVAVGSIGIGRQSGKGDLRGDDVTGECSGGGRRKRIVGGREGEGFAIGADGDRQVSENDLSVIPGPGCSACESGALGLGGKRDVAGLVVGVGNALRVTRFEDGLGGEDLAADDIAVDGIGIGRQRGKGDLRGDDVVFQGGGNRRRQGKVTGGECKGFAVGSVRDGESGKGSFSISPRLGCGTREDGTAGLDGEGGAAGLIVDVADVLVIARFEDRLGGKAFAVDDITVDSVRIGRQRGKSDLRGDDVVFQEGRRRRQGVAAGGKRKGCAVGSVRDRQTGE